MYTPLFETSLADLCKQPMMIDANILMVGIESRACDPKYYFENMKELYIQPLFHCFQSIIIHEMVYNELDLECKLFIDSCSNVTTVHEGGLYGVDPQYTTIFNNISEHERVRYDRSRSKDRGEVYSLAYAAYHGINLFSSKEIMVDDIAKDLKDLMCVKVITFDIIVLLAYVYHNSNDNTSCNKGLKSLYKRYCEDVIKRHGLPATLLEYVAACSDYI